MKIIDCRLRPPIGKHAQNFLFESIAAGQMQHCTHQHGCELPQSAIDRSMPELIGEMDENNVECGFFAIRKGKGYGNEISVELDEAYPGRFRTFIGIEPTDGMDVFQSEVEKYVENGPATGIAMEPAIYGAPWYVDDEKVFPIYEYCQEKKIPVMFTYGGRNPADASYYMPMPMEHVAQTFPDMRILLLHGGWPWVTANCSLALNYRNIYLCADMYLVRAPGYRDYIDAANYFLQDKLMFGSAYPILPIGQTVDFYLNCGIREEVLPKIMYENALRAITF